MKTIFLTKHYHAYRSSHCDSTPSLRLSKADQHHHVLQYSVDTIRTETPAALHSTNDCLQPPGILYSLQRTMEKLEKPNSPPFLNLNPLQYNILHNSYSRYLL